MWEGIKIVSNIKDVLDAVELTDAYLAHLYDMEHIELCLIYLSDSQLAGAGNTMQERQQHIDAAKKDINRMYLWKAAHWGLNLVVGSIPGPGDIAIAAYIVTDIKK